MELDLTYIGGPRDGLSDPGGIPWVQGVEPVGRDPDGHTLHHTYVHHTYVRHIDGRLRYVGTLRKGEGRPIAGGR